MTDFLLTAGMLVAILGSGAVFTQLYCKMAYYTCSGCGSLNAKRRSECRNCAAPLGE